MNLADPLGLNVALGDGMCYIVHIWGHYGPADDPTPFESYSIYCFGGGGGGGDVGDGSSGGGQVKGPTVEEALPALRGADLTRLLADLNLALILAGTKGCDDALRDLWGLESLAEVTSNLAAGAITTDADGNQIPQGNIFDGRTSQSRVTDERGNNVTVEDYFRTHRTVNAITTADAHLVFLGRGYFRGSDIDRAITLIHEAIHRAGFPDTAFGATQEEGSANLTAWLRRNCHL